MNSYEEKKNNISPGTTAISRKIRTLMNCVQTQMEDVSDGKANIILFIFFTMG